MQAELDCGRHEESGMHESSRSPCERPANRRCVLSRVCDQTALNRALQRVQHALHVEMAHFGTRGVRNSIRLDDRPYAISGQLVLLGSA